MKNLIFFVLVLSLAGSSFAVTWDGGGAGNDWDTAANWDTDTVPTASDDATIGGTAAVQVTTLAPVADKIYLTSTA